MPPSKSMSRTRKRLLIQLEKLIGNECYNSKIQNWGPGGVFEGEGRDFRYPITFRNDKGEKVKMHHVEETIAPEMLRGGYYAFGANELHVIAGLERVLQFLERVYGLDVDSPKSQS
jgi:hypothetical protein